MSKAPNVRVAGRPRRPSRVASAVVGALTAAGLIATQRPVWAAQREAEHPRDVVAIQAGVDCASLRVLSSALSLPEDRWMPGLAAGVTMGRAGRWEIAVDGLIAETTSRSRGVTVSGRQVERANGLWLSPRLVIGRTGRWSLGPRIGYVATRVERDADPLNQRVESFLRTCEIAIAASLTGGRLAGVRIEAGLGSALGAASTASPRIEHDWSGPIVRVGLRVSLGPSALVSGVEAPGAVP